MAGCVPLLPADICQWLIMHPLTVAELERWLPILMAADDWAAVDYWGRQLDTLEQRHRHNTPRLAGAALWYAEQGLMVFPLRPTLKTPHRGTHGVSEATCDPDRVRAWWARWPESNIGIATGHVVDVIDIDGPNGVKGWAKLLETDPEPFGQVLGVASTPRPGGTHLYRPATGHHNTAGALAGIDYRGLGGYVVAPPSVNPAGTRYRWRKPLTLQTSTEKGAGGGPIRSIPDRQQTRR
jgi:hypothetical protein